MTLLLIASLTLLFGMPFMIVLCACVAAGRADHLEYRLHLVKKTSQRTRPARRISPQITGY